MRPHTCAAIGVINYLEKVKNGRNFEIQVYTKKGFNATYDIEVKEKTSTRLVLSIGRTWTCQLKITIDDNKYLFEHDHDNNTYAVERFNYYEKEIRDGEHSGGKNRNDYQFSAYLYPNDPKFVNLNDKKLSRDYEITVTRVSS